MTSVRPALSARRRIPGPPRDRIKERLLRLYRGLARRYGPQDWWPGRTPFEIAAGAILTQHTAWTNAARALNELDRRRLLSARAVDGLDEATLAALIRSAGTYRIKARRLKSFTQWLRVRFDGGFAGLRRAPLASVRQELLAVAGLGPETVDAILLYAAGRPVFVADAYTRRVLSRHGLMPVDVAYEPARAFLEAHLPSDPALFNEFHALLVELGKRHCRTSPECADCPLGFDLPQNRATAAARRSQRVQRRTGRPPQPSRGVPAPPPRQFPEARRSAEQADRARSRTRTGGLAVTRRSVPRPHPRSHRPAARLRRAPRGRGRVRPSP